ncbi:MAG: threonine ammonia-lyase [Actinobacteria bacterium]|uniref:threonine ammonia-lyase n=1 Tax=freshwater metagenome TaxID=449393 RepID=A0A6J6DCW0_9ZZZZ|nr:threonine ammonia-lyase [Actinomycetota bacterium]MTA89695.1 threonine ammonia-lyase [Actinomycetota bacterium]
MAQQKFPSLQEFEEAALRVQGVVSKTPLLESHWLTEASGHPVFFKCENLQRTGAYKVRGAYNLISQLTKEEQRKGVVAASAGNHAQGVALAAQLLGIKATIFMPVGASLPKYQATIGYGANVVLSGAIFDETNAAAKEFAQKTGAVYVPPFDHLDIVRGQGTVALEIFDQLPNVDNIVVCLGGGGLTAGVALAAKLKAEQLGRKVKVYAVQAELAAAYPPSLRAGKPIEIKTQPTIADGIAVAKPGKVPFDIISKYVDKVITVSEDEIAKGMLGVLERSKLVVEAGGAVGVAALLAKKLKLKGTTAIVLSGGNIDPLLLQRVIKHGLAASDRYTNIAVMLPDRPGQLVRTAQAVADAHANVVEVLHTRHGNGLQISEVELDLSVETRGKEHRDEVLLSLKQAGLNPKLLND